MKLTWTEKAKLTAEAKRTLRDDIKRYPNLRYDVGRVFVRNLSKSGVEAIFFNGRFQKLIQTTE
jgi:hypothetical protein